MKQYIDKAVIKAELERIEHETNYEPFTDEVLGKRFVCRSLLSFIDTVEVKEVGEKFERPNIEAKNAVEVLSRMPHIDKKLLPIAEFIMDYCSWNLHKDEWNQPVLEVPLFRVLDALVQKGKPYCGG